MRFHSYWRSLAEGKDAPLRSALDPNHIRDLLPKMLIFERDGTAAARCRLMGSYCVDRFGANLTGRDLFTMMGPQTQALIDEAVAHACKAGDGIMLHLKVKSPARRARASSVLLLPFRAATGCQMVGLLTPSIDLPAHSLPNAGGRADKLIIEGVSIFDRESAAIRQVAEPSISFAD